MMPLTLNRLGLQGLDKYTARENLPIEKMAVMSNVRSFKGKIETAPGLTAYSGGSVNGRPLKFFWWQRNNLEQILGLGTTTKLLKFNTSTLVFDDVSHATGNYTGGAGNFWDAAAYNNNSYWTNGVERIQVHDGSASPATDLTSTGAPMTALALASFSTYILAGYVDGDPRKIQWSDSGNGSTWNSGDAGNLTLYQDNWGIYRMLPLGEVLVVYRPWSIHILFYVGPPFIFAQRQIIPNRGVIAPRAMADLGSRHILWGRDGIYYFDGTTLTQVGFESFDAMMDEVDPQFLTSCQVFVDIKDREVYFMYPKSGDVGVCKQGWVFNYWQNTWRQATFTVTAAGWWRRFQDIAWQDATGTWAANPFTWLEMVTTSDASPVTLVGTDTGIIRFIDRSVVNEGSSAMTRIAETGLLEPAALLFQSPGSKCTLNRIDVEQENKGSHNLEVWVGTQDTLSGDAGITWTQYTIVADGTVRTIPVRHTAVFFALRVRTAGSAEPFRVSGLKCWFVKRGDR